jgi:flagellar biosynthetic protein FliP
LLALFGTSWRLGFVALLTMAWLCIPCEAVAQQNPVLQPPLPLKQAEGNPNGVLPNVDQMLSPQGISSTLKLFIVLTVLSLAPSIFIMTTCFVRFIIVFGLLRQALGTQQTPPNQVIVSLCLFLTLSVMSPVWKESYQEGIKPYLQGTLQAAGESPDLALERGFALAAAPIRRFMSAQIEMTGNSDTVWMFIEYQRPPDGSPEAATWTEPKTYQDVGLDVLLPAFLLSELKTAFIIGFQVYLPFLVIDMVVSSVLISMGMMMLPPVLISLPFKLLVFVMIDGWYLMVGMLLESVQHYV